MDSAGAAARRVGRGGGSGRGRRALGADGPARVRRWRARTSRETDRGRPRAARRQGLGRGVRHRRAGAGRRRARGWWPARRAWRSAPSAWARPAPTRRRWCEALRRADPDHAPLIDALVQSGAACAFEVRAAAGGVAVEGRAIGALAFLRLSPLAADAGLPTAARLAAFLDARAAPAWIAARRRRRRPSPTAPGWRRPAPRACAPPATGGLTFDRAADDLAGEAARRRRAARGRALGRRRAAGAAPSTSPPSRWKAAASASGPRTSPRPRRPRESPAAPRRGARRDPEPASPTRVAIFGRDRRLQFHNTAFAELWGLEPAWLAERPEPRRGARPPAPAPPPAGDRRLRRRGRRAELAATRRWRRAGRPVDACRTAAPCAWCASRTRWAACCCCSPTSPAS